jgi:hypothetical protein
MTRHARRRGSIGWKSDIGLVLFAVLVFVVAVLLVGYTV